MKSSMAFLLGVGVGALSVALVRRIEERLDEEDEDELAMRMRAYIRQLEERAQAVVSHAKPAPKAAKARARAKKAPAAKRTPRKRA